MATDKVSTIAIKTGDDIAVLTSAHKPTTADDQRFTGLLTDSELTVLQQSSVLLPTSRHTSDNVRRQVMNVQTNDVAT